RAGSDSLVGEGIRAFESAHSRRAVAFPRLGDARLHSNDQLTDAAESAAARGVEGCPGFVADDGHLSPPRLAGAGCSLPARLKISVPVEDIAEPDYRRAAVH